MFASTHPHYAEVLRTECRTGHRQRLRCLLTIRGGEIVYNPNRLGVPGWENATA